MQVAREAAPDFRWPGRACEKIAFKLEKLVGILSGRLRDEWDSRSPAGVALRILAGLPAIYALVVLVAYCYVEYPVSPYGFWDVVRWGLVPLFFLFVTACMVYVLARLSMFLLFFMYAAGYLILSLVYLAWIIPNAYLRRSSWLKGYRLVLPGSLLVTVGLAIFIDGSYRFWDERFAAAAFIRTLLICLSAWAALFCLIAGNRALRPGAPRKIFIWTLLLAVPVALYVYWHARILSVEYFLRKNVAERPTDETAWLELARHYLNKADEYASQEPNEDYTPPDPRPYYEKALECFNRAVELGEGRFQTHLARARIADTLEMKTEAKAYGEAALNAAPPGEGHELRDQIKWLGEMVARNSDSVRREVDREEIEARIRLRRLGTLPPIVRWGVSRFR